MYDPKYKLSDELIRKALSFSEFSMGGAQATVLTSSGKVFPCVLISNFSYVIAVRGHDTLPFELSEVVDIYQTKKDRNPRPRGDWNVFEV